MAVFYDTFRINLSISLGTSLAPEIIEGFAGFFFKFGFQVYLGDLISLFSMV